VASDLFKIQAGRAKDLADVERLLEIDLTSARRLHGMIDVSPAGVTARLREVEMLRRTCIKLARLRRPKRDSAD